MLLSKGQVAGGALDVSTSLTAVDELVQMKIQKLFDDNEEQKIAYQR